MSDLPVDYCRQAKEHHYATLGAGVQLHCCCEVGCGYALLGISSAPLVEADALGFKDFPRIIRPFWV